MTISLNISTGTDEGPVTRRLCFAVVLFLLQLLTDCTDDLLFVSVTVRAVVWAGSGVEGVSL